MGLPVIKRRNGQSQHEYESYCIYVVKNLDRKNYDGYANKNSRDILFRFKDYLELSFVYICTLVGLIRSFDRIGFIWDIDPYFQAYDNAFVVRRVKRNIGRMTKSLRSQRVVAYAFKNCVKQNALSAQWTEVFNARVDQFNERLNTIMRLVNENLEATPYILYTAYLKKHGISIVDDLKTALDNDYFNLIYAEQYDSGDERILNHICDIFKLAMKEPDLIAECVTNAKQYNEATKRRSEQRKKEKEEEEAAIFESRRKEAMEILSHIASRAESMYKSGLKTEKSRALKHYNAGYKPFYIVASINTAMFSEKINRHRYVPNVFYAASNNTREFQRTSDIARAKKFLSIEEAEAYEKELIKAKPGMEAIVCTIDLAWNTAC